MEAGGVTREITRPGYTVSVAPGQPPTEPAPASDADLDQSLSALEEGGRDEEEGDGTAVSDNDVAESGIAEEGSSNAPSDLGPSTGTPLAAVETGVDTTEVEDTAETDTASQTTASESSGSGLTISSTIVGRLKHATTPANGTDDTTSTNNLTFSNGSVSGGIFSASTSQGEFKANIETGSFTAESTAQPFGSSALTGTGFVTSDEKFGFYELTDSGDGHKVVGWGGVPVTGAPTSGTTFYALQDDFVLDSKFPFLRNADGGSLTPAEAEGTSDTAIVWDTSGSSTAVRAFGHRTLLISGTGSSQKSVMSLAVGKVTLSSNLPILDGVQLATSRLSTSGTMRMTDGDIQSSEAGSTDVDFFGGGTDANYFVLESDTADSDGVEALVSGTSTAIFPNAIALKVDDTVGTRTSDTYNGYSGGAFQVVNSSGSVTSSVVFQNETSDPNDITIKTSATTNKIAADINVKDANTSSFTFLRMDFGDDDTALGDSSATSGDSVFIDDNNFGAADHDTTPVSISTGTASDVAAGMISVSKSSEFDSGFIPSGVSVCSCAHLSWGFWSGDFAVSSNRNQIHMATWVAGDIPALSAITALSGSASYTGHAIGSVINSSDVYLAIGSWNYTVNFDTPSSSSGTLTNFDSGGYTMGGLTLASASNSLHTFSGSITGSSGTGSGRSGSLLGSFMESSSEANANMGGHFSISGTNYKASGVFAATK